MTLNLQTLGYGLAGLVFVLLAALLATSFRGRAKGGILIATAVLSAAWGLGLAFEAMSPETSALRVFWLELLFDGAWLLFLAVLMSGAVGTAQAWLARFGGALLALAILVTGTGLDAYARATGADVGAGSLLVIGSLLTSLYGLVIIEQIYRNARESHRDGLKFLCLGVGGIFAYDLFLYSNAILVGAISGVVWSARGFVVAMCVPLIAVAVRRAPSWSVGIFVSRQIVFYSATLLGAGVYLTVVGFLGYYVRLVGGEWGSAAQLILFAAAFLVLGVFLFSDTSRARLRVFINKHFFENKYDYREEWLRLIDTLTSLEEGLPLRKRGIKALAQIAESPSGLLYLRSQDRVEYRCAANWNTPEYNDAVPADASLPRFLERSGWVIERREYARDASHYASLELHPCDLDEERSAFIVPLLHDGELLGFVTLSEPATPATLNYEDRDLLKTAGQQIASYLAQEIATEQLAESRQFEAYNRLTAYIMHDLKNLVAQQSLMVENAQRHKNNPEFIDDAIDTIKGSVRRMRRVIEHIQQRSQEQPAQKIEVGKLVMQAVSQCADREPAPRARIGDQQIWVRADRERLLMAIYHAIRNAQDATPADGSVNVEVTPNGRECAVSIVDTGRGMDDAFVRERLFRPFDSTKGTSGMGIGAYQIRETVRMAGGRIDVDSAPGRGTRLSMVLAVEPDG